MLSDVMCSTPTIHHTHTHTHPSNECPDVGKKLEEGKSTVQCFNTLEGNSQSLLDLFLRAQNLFGCDGLVLTFVL